jgi:hypothetical protein
MVLFYITLVKTLEQKRHVEILLHVWKWKIQNEIQQAEFKTNECINIHKK